MLGLSVDDMLRLWEEGVHQHSLDRALTILEAAYHDRTRDEFASLSIGSRDALLLALRARTFGDRLESFAECPACSERLEFELSAAQVLSAAPKDDLRNSDEAMVVDFDGYSMQLSLPNTLDLQAIARAHDVTNATNRLLVRCVSSVRRDGADIRVHELPSEVVEKIDAWMAEKDPLAQVTISLNCAACAHSWDVVFEVVDFVWTDISLRAKRLLREVHILAKEYGWHEQHILAMTAVRRQFYLNLLGEA